MRVFHLSACSRMAVQGAATVGAQTLDAFLMWCDAPTRHTRKTASCGRGSEPRRPHRPGFIAIGGGARRRPTHTGGGHKDLSVAPGLGLRHLLMVVILTELVDFVVLFKIAFVAVFPDVAAAGVEEGVVSAAIGELDAEIASVRAG
jgi:hypothetical protein